MPKIPVDAKLQVSDRVRELWLEHEYRRLGYELAKDNDTVVTIKLADSREFELFLITMVMVLEERGEMLIAAMLQARLRAFFPHLAEEYRQFKIDACWVNAHIDNQLFDRRTSASEVS